MENRGEVKLQNERSNETRSISNQSIHSGK